MHCKFITAIAAIAVSGGLSQAASITLPGGSLTVSSLNSAPATFAYTGTLSQSDTITLTVSGDPTDPCLQSGPVYCTNAAGVITLAGSSPVGATTTFSGTFGGTSGAWNYGSLIMTISGVGAVQLFAANSSNGLGSATPPASLTFTAESLASLGFGSFSVVNPTIGFVLADNNYPDNAGSYLLTQSSSGTPEPATVGLIGLGLLAIVGFGRRRRRGRARLLSNCV